VDETPDTNSPQVDVYIEWIICPGYDYSNSRGIYRVDDTPGY